MPVRAGGQPAAWQTINRRAPRFPGYTLASPARHGITSDMTAILAAMRESSMPKSFTSVSIRRLAGTAAAAAALFIAAAPAGAYEVNPVGSDFKKWGPSNAGGTPGGIVSWGFMAAGTLGSAYCGNACPGSSTLTLPNFYADPANSNTTTPTSLFDLQGLIQAAFDKWSAVANLQFVYVAGDTQLPVNDPAAIVPMVRVGAFAFNSNSIAAVGYSPPPNGGTGSGDLLFNTNVGFQSASGAEGSALRLFPEGGGFYMNDLNGLALHEIGHALGLGHSADDTTVMCGGATPDCLNLTRVTQQLKADDIAGAQFLYGAAPVPEPAAWLLALAGLPLLAIALRRRG